MSQLDLGELKGQLLLFGGPYSNYQATHALKKRAEQLAIPPKNIICTGDVVAYCSQPNETIELLRDWNVHILKGNCEESLGNNADDCGCGFEKGSACDLLSDNWYPYASRIVRLEHKNWMRELPSVIRFQYCGKQFQVIHGGVAQINQFVFESTDLKIKENQILDAGVDGIIAGHCGLPFTQIINDRLWHNPGVIGMPANDGTSNVWFSTWQCINDEIRINHCELQYNSDEASQAMIQNGLNNSYSQALVTGIWPSMDVLPDIERQLKGKPVNESSIGFNI